MMDMTSKNQYLEALMKKRDYFSRTKEEKTKILDEYCQITGQNRNYVIRKINSNNYLSPNFGKRSRKVEYSEDFIHGLAKIWKFFDEPCGKKLSLLLKNRVDELRKAGRLSCTEEAAQKLKKISSSTIDLKLRAYKKRNQEKDSVRVIKTASNRTKTRLY